MDFTIEVVYVYFDTIFCLVFCVCVPFWGISHVNDLPKSTVITLMSANFEGNAHFISLWTKKNTHVNHVTEFKWLNFEQLSAASGEFDCIENSRLMGPFCTKAAINQLVV